ncbi:hypothetical protein Taro_051877 [Colocasia esculenta]|uniref:Cysteine-rich receptor-like protein kinase 10 n=1 Tax=Colocasia esculenta TaxID=4460 RepID=A0A843XHQ7_COLES|nr:hypothetical protein [Colocasia esculenta]
MARPFSSSPKLLHMLLLGALLILLLVLPTTVSAEPLVQICSPTGPDYAANSTFQANLNRLLSSLQANGSTTGFYNATVGAGTDRVYGLVLCRGDKGPGDCRSCLDTAAQDVPQTCPKRRSAVIWYDYCMLRYSDRAFFSIPDDTLKVALVNTQNLTEVTQFNRQLNTLMRELVRYAAYNASARMFATGEAEYGQAGTPTIYGLVQCTRDQSADDCSACLGGIFNEMPSLFFGKIGARYLKATCNYRYELYPFYNSSVMVSVPLSTNATPPTAALQPPPAAPGKKKKSNSTGTVLAIAISLSAAFALVFLICICFCRRKSKQRKLCKNMRDTQDITTIESLSFDLSTLRVATGNFSELNLLGQGGFGAVYKGLLPNGQEIAVKRLLAGSGQGVEELKNEVVLLAKLQHRNLVRLLGVCLEGEEKLLVYEYVPNRSLDKFLFDAATSHQLNWERRYQIIGGISRGLQYLHEDSQVKIIHRDLKASNVLLDADMNSKISDFGLARLFAVDQTHARTSRVVGTFGYMSPEYAMRGHFSNKSDVFSFGVLVLEIVTGQRNSAFSDSSTSTDLLTHVWEHWTSGTVLQIVDPSLGGQYQSSEVMRCVQIGLLCVQEAPAERPTMTSVVLMLSSYSVTLQVPRRPAFVAGYSQSNLGAFKKALEPSTSTTDEESAAMSVLYSTNEVSITELDPR